MGSLLWASADRAALSNVRFIRSDLEFDWGWCGEMVVCSVPLMVRYDVTVRDKYSRALSV